MELFVDGKVNISVFDPMVRRGTHDLSEVVLAAMNTHSPAIESTHFLIAVGRIDNGLTARLLQSNHMTPTSWQKGLSSCTRADTGRLTPMELTADAFDPTGKATLAMAAERCASLGQETISEGNLLLSALQNATPDVQSLFRDTGLSITDWCREIERMICPRTAIEVFEDESLKPVKWDAFSPVAQHVLLVMKNDAESLGYEMIDTRHLLLALVEQEGGATCAGLHHQRISPRRIQESLTLSLRTKAKSRRSDVKLDSEHLQAVLRRILRTSGELAAKDGVDRVHEPHLLRAVLEVETVARRILQEENVDIARLSRGAEHAELVEEEPAEQQDLQAVADIDAVERHLKAQLVGQDDAVRRILPYIQRMRFGFMLPERPAGVFLFCGPSGSGKTQMAKELARAIFGSEEAMIYLEMGQFNSRESMNIFVGAPPGYVGYGEGKLTNGLRDKPRSVVLLDEVEKAHPLVLDALLRFLDEGKIDDPAGPVRDGSHCVVVLTSNVGAEELGRLWAEVEKNPSKRAAVRQRLREVFRRHHFRVEFLNRVDELICFRALGWDDYTEIARRSIERHLSRLRDERHIDVCMDGVCEAIGRYCAQISEGARAAHRLGLSVVVTPVIDFVLRERCKPPVKLRVTAGDASEDAEPTGVVTKA
jgi:ATP-dependent Clp protease ATP-binding subunit ClpA